MGSWSGRWSGCRRRRGWLVGEGAVETLKGAPAVGARESARGDIHRILPRYHRRGIEVEPYRRSTTTSAVRRDPVNRKNARGGGRTDKAADVNGKISQLGKDNAVTGWLGTGRCTRRLTGRWRYTSSRRRSCCTRGRGSCRRSYDWRRSCRRRWSRRPPSGNAESINLVVIGYVDASARYHTTVPLAGA
jgi:hypothetical protein